MQEVLHRCISAILFA